MIAFLFYYNIYVNFIEVALAASAIFFYRAACNADAV